MAKVVAKVLGGNPKNCDVGNVRELKRQLGVESHTANVNGKPADDDQDLKEDDYVSLSPAVKGGK